MLVVQHFCVINERTFVESRYARSDGPYLG